MIPLEFCTNHSVYGKGESTDISKKLRKALTEIDEAEYKERKEAAKARMEAANGSK